MALFLPLFFGMILGDAGYGLVLLLLCAWGLAPLQSAGHDAEHDYRAGHWFRLEHCFWPPCMASCLAPWANIGGCMRSGWSGAAPIRSRRCCSLPSPWASSMLCLGLLLGLYAALRARSRGHTLERGGILVGLIGLFLNRGCAGRAVAAGIDVAGICAACYWASSCWGRRRAGWASCSGRLSSWA